MINLAIHTTEHAALLKNILESHGVHVKLENYAVSGESLIVAEKVLIEEKDLPLALKLVESGESISAFQTAMKMAGMGSTLLIPVDFSDSSMIAVRMGFYLAEMLDLKPVVLHCCAAPMFDSLPAANPFPSDAGEDVDAEIAENMAGDIRRQQEIKLRALKKKIKDAQLQGRIADVRFSTELLEGVAEEVILTWCKMNQPQLVVMATRGVHKKEEDLIGSVTAEVLDSCRVPVLTIPDNFSLHADGFSGKRNYMVFCNLDEHDIMTIDTLMRMFRYPECNVTLVPVPSRSRVKVKGKADALCRFLSDNYPASRFYIRMVGERDFREEIDRIIREDKTDLLIVPNKKTNIFSRIFHPTIAHRFLFERDMPMLALPV